MAEQPPHSPKDDKSREQDRGGSSNANVSSPLSSRRERERLRITFSELLQRHEASHPGHADRAEIPRREMYPSHEAWLLALLSDALAISQATEGDSEHQEGSNQHEHQDEND